MTVSSVPQVVEDAFVPSDATARRVGLDTQHVAGAIVLGALLVLVLMRRGLGELGK